MYVSVDWLRILSCVCVQASFVILEFRFWILLFEDCFMNASNVLCVKMAGHPWDDQRHLPFAFLDICIASNEIFHWVLEGLEYLQHFIFEHRIILYKELRKNIICYHLDWHYRTVHSKRLLNRFLFMQFYVYGVNLYMWFHIHCIWVIFFPKCVVRIGLS